MHVPCAAYYSCALNSFVHVLMYTHYLLSAMLGKDMRARRKYLWWSRYLTQFQMFQFVTMMVQVWALSPVLSMHSRNTDHL